jgi:hypothetical protein
VISNGQAAFTAAQADNIGVGDKITVSGATYFISGRQSSTVYAVTTRTGSSRLIGRSIWNTKWMLIIPAGGLGGSTLDEGLRRFVNSVSDISIEFRTYSYGGN